MKKSDPGIVAEGGEQRGASPGRWSEGPGPRGIREALHGPYAEAGERVGRRADTEIESHCRWSRRRLGGRRPRIAWTGGGEGLEERRTCTDAYTRVTAGEHSEAGRGHATARSGHARSKAAGADPDADRTLDEGFRPGRGAHDALDALAYAIDKRKVNWILDADVSKYFDRIDREQLLSFLSADRTALAAAANERGLPIDAGQDIVGEGWGRDVIGPEGGFSRGSGTVRAIRIGAAGQGLRKGFLLHYCRRTRKGGFGLGRNREARATQAVGGKLRKRMHAGLAAGRSWGPVLAALARMNTVARVPIRRGWPCALGHARNCAGGARQRASLPRRSQGQIETLLITWHYIELDNS